MDLKDFTNKLSDIPKIKIPPIEPILPSIMNLPDQSTVRVTNKISSLMENLEKNNLLSEIDKLNYELEWKKKEKEKLEKRLKAIEKNNDNVDYIKTFGFITLISVIIPFIFIIFNNILNNSISKFFLIIYIIVTFLISMSKMYQYLKK